MTISTVLKTKLGDRGEFARQAIAHADAAFNEFSTSLEAVIAAHSENMIQLEKEEATADEILQGKKVEQQTAEAAWLTAENTWCLSTQVEMDKRSIVDDSKYKSADLSKDLDKAKEVSASFSGTMGHFHRLRDRSLEESKVESAVEAAPPATDGTEMIVDPPVS